MSRERHAEARASVTQDIVDRVIATALKGARTRNPLVGALVLDTEGTVRGEGFHAGSGSAHAEVLALAQAGRHARGGTLVVSLTPCATQGLTPPCTEAILAARPSRVVYLSEDPSQGESGWQLRGSGIEVVSVPNAAARALNARWFAAQAQGRPFITAKIATTADGFLAARDGSSRWITNGAARADAHRLRARADAIAVGGGTLRQDNPRLTVRHAAGDGQSSGDHLELLRAQPSAVVFSARRLPRHSHLAARPSGQVLRFSGRDLPEDLRTLAARGLRHLLVEGGASLLGSLLRLGLVDQLVRYVCPDLLGSGTRALAFEGIENLCEAQRWAPDMSDGGDMLRLEASAERIPPGGARSGATRDSVANYRIQTIREDTDDVYRNY